MTELTLFPSDIAEMSISQLAALPTDQLSELDKNLTAAIDGLKSARAKFDVALELRYGEQAHAVLSQSGHDFGSGSFHDGSVCVQFDLPPCIHWDQSCLSAIAHRLGR